MNFASVLLSHFLVSLVIEYLEKKYRESIILLEFSTIKYRSSLI